MKFYCVLIDKPEVHVSPNKVFISSPPTQVKINCTVSSYPASDIIWIYRKKDTQVQRQKRLKHHRSSWNKLHGRRRARHNNHHRATHHLVEDEDSEAFVLENNIILNTEIKYSIYLQSVNDTYKQSSIIIDIENEKDYGIYACYANNSAGSRSQRFYIYGGKSKLINS